MTQSAPDPPPFVLAVAFEDDHLLVANKPPHVLVHPVAVDQPGTLAGAVADYYREKGIEAKIHLVHRLDRDTSGLVAIAKTPEVHARLDRQLRARTMRRGYLAFVLGSVDVESGMIDAPIGRDPDDPPLRAVREDGAPARTRFEVAERYPGATLLRLELETGRTHQIRVHLAHRGHPILGDQWYGRAGLDLVPRQALHAARLRLVHPATGDALDLEAPLPADLAALRESLIAGALG